MWLVGVTFADGFVYETTADNLKAREVEVGANIEEAVRIDCFLLLLDGAIDDGVVDVFTTIELKTLWIQITKDRTVIFNKIFKAILQ